MPISSQELLAKIDKAYRVYYDPAEIRPGPDSLVARYTYRRTDQAYVLTRKATVWSTETNEHVFVFSIPHLTEALWRECRDEALRRGMDCIRPHSEHRCSMITALVLCGKSDDKALRAAESCRLRKYFRFGFHGWMDFRSAVVVLDPPEVHVNRAAADMQEFLKKNIEKCTETP